MHMHTGMMMHSDTLVLAVARHNHERVNHLFCRRCMQCIGYIYIYIFIYMCIYIYIYIYDEVFVLSIRAPSGRPRAKHVGSNDTLHTYLSLCVYMCVRAYICIYVYTYIYIYCCTTQHVHTCIYIYTNIYIYIDI